MREAVTAYLMKAGRFPALEQAQVAALIHTSTVATKDGPRVDMRKLHGSEYGAITIALYLSKRLRGLMDAHADEVKQFVETYEQLSNKLGALADHIEPELLRQVQKVRSVRMTVVNEMHECLSAMRDVREFFLERGYEEEMARLERFVAVCKEIQQLKASGVFDAVCDSALKLAVTP